MAAFSALRLAKFNLDERQALGFIGLPTPANALFWGALVLGLEQYDVAFEGMEWAILIGTFFSSYLLIAEIPMFALKFKHWGFNGNEIKYLFLISCVPMLLMMGVSSFAPIIAWYVILSVVTYKSKK
jgi:CDP-diacylglycerol--serine O-phosphatidyltransferase